MHESVATRWLALLAERTAVLTERLVSEDETTRDLRPSTPLTFAVPRRERRAIRSSLPRLEFSRRHETSRA